MLCDRCASIKFNFSPTAGRPKDHSLYILHRDHDSFLRSVSLGCHLCNLIKGQLDIKYEDQAGDDQVLRDTADVMDALYADQEVYMIVMAERPPNNTSIKDLSIVSQIGVVFLKAIGLLPGLTPLFALGMLCTDFLTWFAEPYSQVCQVDYPNICQGSPGPLLDGADLGHANSAPECSNLPSDLVSKENQRSDGTLSPVAVNTGLACLWIDHCLQNHEYCKLGHQQSKLAGVSMPPTLLINVTTPSHPFLEPTTATTIRSYLALSYCWGTGGNLKTLNDNYEDHKNRIPAENLPRTVMDAIDVTHQLGCQYLWVDALCIIQDNDEMRNKELSRMGDIYVQALLTIYAERGRACTDGLFKYRNPRLYRPCQLTWLEETVDGATTTTHSTVTVNLQRVNHLQNRAWVLQEEILSSRRLIFGKQIAWACTAATASETHPVPKDEKDPLTNWLGSSLGRLRMRLFAPELTSSMQDGAISSYMQRRDNFNAWYSIVEDYSGRNLTLATDRLPALAGLAASFARAQASTYLAGLWKEDIQIGLGWYVAMEQDAHNLENIKASEPTWSWAHVGKMQVRFRFLEPNSTHLVSKGSQIVNAGCCVPQCGRTTNGYIELKGSLKKLTLQCTPASSHSDIQKEIRGRDPEFKVGSLVAAATKVRARFTGLILDPETRRIVGMAALDQWPHEETNLLPQTQTPQHASKEKSEEQIFCLLLSVFKRPYMDRSLLYLTCLILEVVDDANFVCRRRGLAVLDDNAWSLTEPSDIDSDDSLQLKSVRKVTLI